MTKKKSFIVFISVASVVAVVLILWVSGLIGLWTNGVAYVANNTDKSGTAKSHILKGTYSISIDLKN